MEDEQAIARCQAGDLEAFRHLVERYQTEAFGHALTFLRQRQDAEDAVQNAFVKAWHALGRFEAGRRFYPWFYTILRNCCFKLAARRPTTTPEGGERLTLLTAAEDGEVPPDQTRLLEEALLHLSADDRELVTLKHLDGLSYAELAERLGIPLGTVMSRLYHARLRLRVEMKRLNHEHHEYTL